MGAAAIATNLTELTSLDLEENHIGDALDATAIAEHLTKLKTLRFGDNNIGDAGIKGHRRTFNQPQIA